MPIITSCRIVSSEIRVGVDMTGRKEKAVKRLIAGIESLPGSTGSFSESRTYRGAIFDAKRVRYHDLRLQAERLAQVAFGRDASIDVYYRHDMEFCFDVVVISGWLTQRMTDFLSSQGIDPYAWRVERMRAYTLSVVDDSKIRLLNYHLSRMGS